MASPNLVTEVAAVISFAVEETQRTYDVKSYPYADRKSQKLLLRSTKQRRWKVVWENQTATEKDALQAFWDARRGTFEMFYWNPPGTTETDVPVYFDSDLQTTFKTGRVWDLSAYLIETAA